MELKELCPHFDFERSGCFGFMIPESHLSIWATPYWEGENTPLEVHDGEGNIIIEGKLPFIPTGDAKADAVQWVGLVVTFADTLPKTASITMLFSKNEIRAISILFKELLTSGVWDSDAEARHALHREWPQNTL
ncbi:MAG: hypothetical protein WCH43_03445 [Verrucomicrobiota bacterium]